MVFYRNHIEDQLWSFKQKPTRCY